MSKGAALSSLRKGDIVRGSQVYEVDRVLGDYVELIDRKSGSRAGYTQDWVDARTAKFEVLKKARPGVGETITARELRDTPWRRGTVIKTSRRVYMLEANGDWVTPWLPMDGETEDGEDGGFVVSFDWLTLSDQGYDRSLRDKAISDDDLDEDIRFTIVHLP